MSLAFIQPILLYIFALVIGGLWVWRGGDRHLACMALGFCLFATGLVLQIVWLPHGPVIPPLVSGLVYCAGAVAIALSVLQRAGRATPSYLAALLLICLMVTLGRWYYAAVENSLAIRAYILNFGLGAIILVGVLGARPLAAGSRSDRIIFWLILVVALHFFPRMMLTAATISEDDSAQVATTAFWRANTFAFALLGVVAGLGVIVATMSDVLADLRNERDTDSLTGLTNRRGLEAGAEELLAKADAAPVSFVLCDLDNFKAVNDRYGHQAGDKVLRAFADTLRANARADDLLGRLGGEEFVVMLPRLSTQQALAFAERLRLAVAAASFEDVAPGLIMTCSFGVAQARPGESFANVLARADELLYAAKHNGRNRTYAESIGPGGRLQAAQHS